ncbi:MAG: ABC transporter permease [Spirochaetaceae bacterium]|jgi:simple sugar transport system permease protein|nr:ABC transporter permease [Spirochaetaceae bacterium]
MIGFKIRFEKRTSLHPVFRLIIPGLCILLALVFCGFLMLSLGYNPLRAYQRLLRGSFGSPRNASESILQAVPLMLCALGVSVSFKMSVNNIGAEGQFAWGAFAATLVALYCPWVPRPLVLPLMFAAGFVAGGLWAVLAVLPRAFWGVNEIIITLMFNYAALLWVDFWVYGPWRDAGSGNLPYSKVFPAHALAPTLGNTRITVAVFFAIIAALLIHFFFSKTVRGYQIRVIGASGNAARYAGMNVISNILIVMFFSGALAGLAGVAQVSGSVGRLQPELSGGAGYTAIIIAYLSHFNPLTVLIVSVLFGGLNQGKFSMQLIGVPVEIVTAIQGFILFFVLGGEIFIRNKLVVLRLAGGEGK